MAEGQIGEASRAASGYSFVLTPGRQTVIAAYDTLIDVLRARADLHKAHDNADLRELTLRFAQRALGDVERICRKWEDSDARGKTY